jgi:Ricin-type beta-trefoil lectin domain-like
MPEEGKVYVITIAGSNLALDLLDNAQNDFAGIGLYADNGGDNQKWQLAIIDGDYYRFASRQSGKVLTALGSAVVQNENNGSDEQRWQIAQSGEGYSIKSKANGDYLTASGDNLSLAAEGAGKQAWSFKEASLFD